VTLPPTPKSRCPGRPANHRGFTLAFDLTRLMVMPPFTGAHTVGAGRRGDVELLAAFTLDGEHRPVGVTAAVEDAVAADQRGRAVGGRDRYRFVDPVLGRMTRPNCRSLFFAMVIGWKMVIDAVADVVAVAWARAEVAMAVAATTEPLARRSFREVFKFMAPKAGRGSN